MPELNTFAPDRGAFGSSEAHDRTARVHHPASKITFILHLFIGRSPGKAKQYRLIEGNESEKFLACFKGAPIIMQGGIASGFRHVTKEKKADLRLLHIKKTRRKIRVMECAVDAGLVKGADVFVLDAGDHFFQWNGPGCSAFEKRRANEVVRQLTRHAAAVPHPTASCLLCTVRRPALLRPV